MIWRFVLSFLAATAASLRCTADPAKALPALGPYDRGATGLFASRIDQRFSYCLYVPKGYDDSKTDLYPLVVLIHGTDRGAQRFRDLFSEFAEQHHCILLAPLFPSGILEPGEVNNYKFIAFHDIRFDRVLLGMVDEIAAKYRIASRRFLLFGFSGGGHFVHRFFYLHPDRLAAVSIGAPGMVTLLGDPSPFWKGTGDFEAKFGSKLDIDAMKQVAVQMVVGGNDTDTWEITIHPGEGLWMPGANDAGRTRIERIQSLRRSFVQHGIAVRLDIVPGVGHQGYSAPIIGAVQDFFVRFLQSDPGRALSQG